MLNRTGNFGRHLARQLHACMGNRNSSPCAAPDSARADNSIKAPGQIHSSAASEPIRKHKTPIATITYNKTMTMYAKKPITHVKCRNCIYTRTKDIQRFPVPDDKLSWSVNYPEYNPVDFVGPNVAVKPVWADIDYKHEGGSAKWNEIDGKVDRRSHMGPYDIIDLIPRNPVGRTGVCARGHLGRWGPNHAADPIVTRWKRDASGNIVKSNGLQVLQFVSIQRGDSGEWALPGGMVTPGEALSLTLKREFSEETMNSLEVSNNERERIMDQVNRVFQQGHEVYRGYVDDPRNTDNAWMETVAVNFHDETGESVGLFKLNAGDDAVGVRWTDMSSGLSLYASHSHFIEQVAKHHKASW